MTKLAVYRTAQATPGLLIILSMAFACKGALNKTALIWTLSISGGGRGSEANQKVSTLLPTKCYLIEQTRTDMSATEWDHEFLMSFWWLSHEFIKTFL